MNGKVKRIPEGKSFGFIETLNGKEYFFHKVDFLGFFNDLIQDLDNEEAIEVSFEPNDTPKGLRASNVRRIRHPNEG